jgi:cyclophilin family peptidyl-prolyl cis-trans isomerase
MFKKMNGDFLQQRIRNATNEYEVAAGLIAVAEDPGNYKFILDRMQNTDIPVIKTACIKGLLNIAVSKSFARLRNDSQKEIIDQLVSSLQSGDVGLVTESLGVLDLDLDRYGYETTVIIQRAEQNLQLPRDMEAHIGLQQKLANINGTTYSLKDDLQFTHQIDWKSLDEIGSSNQAVIETNKGSFSIDLYPDISPGTVANFVDLVNLNYYAGKPLHRVVPGFVIQGGCNRGDGYGSLDYNIRSELSQVYYDEPGYMGMASAGNHTESAQWFVTQGASPHLDGRYTIFGKVSDGMEVVYRVEVGDTIQRITIQ